MAVSLFVAVCDGVPVWLLVPDLVFVGVGSLVLVLLGVPVPEGVWVGSALLVDEEEGVGSEVLVCVGCAVELDVGDGAGAGGSSQVRTRSSRNVP